MRKFEFPESVLEALKIVHLQCEKMSLNPTSTLMSKELGQVTDFVDEFIFGNPQKKSKKLNCIEQLQVIEAIIQHFDEEVEYGQLCSVFMVVFLAKGRDVDLKMDTLSKLLCLNLAQGHKTLLNCAALWLTQQSVGAAHCTQLARSIVQDYLILLPETADKNQGMSELIETPKQSPLLAGILLTHFCDLYKVSSQGTGFKAPPIQLVRLATSWLMDHRDLCGADATTSSQNVVTMMRISPIPGLLTWSILGPLVQSSSSKTPSANKNGICEEDNIYSQLHLAVLLHISQHNLASSFPPNSLPNLTENLMAVLDAGVAGSVSDHSPAVSKALDRYGQALQAALAAGSQQVDQDLLLLIDQLPYNRLVHIVTSNIR